MLVDPAVALWHEYGNPESPSSPLTGDRDFFQAGRALLLEGQGLGRGPLDVDRHALVRDRLAGISLTDVAKKYGVSRASVVRFVREAKQRGMVAAA